MEYTVQKLSQLAGISARTIRYYDEIGILKPARINSSGYRIYGRAEVDRLQQILFYRELGVDLQSIKKIMSSPAFDEVKALSEHREQLLARRKQLDLLIRNVEKTIAQRKKGSIMMDKEKFEGFKRKLIEENEQKYGQEIRAKYGEKTVEESNRKFMSMTVEQHAEFTRLEKEIKETLRAAVQTNDPAGELAQKAAELHRRWLGFCWTSYSKEAHAGLAQMYVDDPRFTAYYDEIQPGTAEFFKDAILIYTGLRE
jgi:DNA-binding transcriptional MerR regulator